jgi:hypothetical protein
MLNILTERMNVNIIQSNAKNKFNDFLKTVKVGTFYETFDDAKEELL